LNVIDSLVSGNSGNNRGGGILTVDCALSMVNSTVAANSASYGGGIYVEDGVGSITNSVVNSTISGNSADGAGGILVYKATLALANTVVSANTVAAGNEDTADLGQSQSTVTAQYSLLGSALDVGPVNDAGSHNLFTDEPGLGALQDNGGPTWSMALLDGSLAIDNGSNALAQTDGYALDCDQRASGDRIYNGTVDIGAFESQGDRIFAGTFEPLP